MAEKRKDPIAQAMAHKRWDKLNQVEKKAALKPAHDARRKQSNARVSGKVEG